MSQRPQTVALPLRGFFGALDLSWATYGAIGALSVALACAYRLVTLRVAMFDGDEYAFALVARDVLHGMLPNTGVFDNKPVGLTYLFALAEAVGGQTVAALRALGFVASAACGALLYQSSRTLGLNRATALSIAGLFMLGALCIGGFGSMSELLAAPLLAAANFLLVGEKRGSWTLVAVGTAFGLACQITYLAAPCAALTMAGVVLFQPPRPIWARLRDGALTGLACAIAASAVWLPQLVTGTWWDYAAEQVRYHHGYREASINWGNFEVGFALPLAGICLPILVACLLRMSREGAKGLPPLFWVLGPQLLGATLAAAASNRFYPHYLILALPSAALLTAVLLADAPEPGRRIGGGVLSVMVAVMAVLPVGFIRARLEARDVEVKAAAVAERLIGPDQRIFVFDESHAIYFLAQRAAASRYIFPTHYLTSCEHTPAIISPTAALAQALARRPALVLVGRRCQPEIDAEAQVRGAGYQRIAEIKDGARVIAFYRDARRPGWR